MSDRSPASQPSDDSRERLLARIAVLERERDLAREECGHEKRMRASVEAGQNRWVTVASAAKNALVSTGYFTEDQVGAHDLAPRIAELWAAFGWCFCKDVALLRGVPWLLHGVQHTRDGCGYWQPPLTASQPPEESE